jgi:hypothetical protein
MLVMYLCITGIDVGHVFVYYGYRCWSYICVLGYRCWPCICVLEISMLIMYLCARGIDVAHVFVY